MCMKQISFLTEKLEIQNSFEYLYYGFVFWQELSSFTIAHADKKTWELRNRN